MSGNSCVSQLIGGRKTSGFFRRNYRPIRMISAVGICVVVAGLALVVRAPAAAASVQSNLNYVALGDSYSSGEGIPPFDPGTDGNGDYCHRNSLFAYPAYLSSAYNTAAMKFYACSGAPTGAVTGDLYWWTEPPQWTRPGVDTTANLVTLTVGGDDAGFSPVLQACIKQKILATLYNAAIGPIGQWLGFGKDPSCANSTTFTSSVDAQVNSVTTNVEQSYATLRSITDPVHTSIVAADYPLIFPTTQAEQTCIQLSPYLTTDDQNWLNSEGNTLDTNLQTAAAQAGVNMVDVRSLFAGHAVCGNSGAWINGVSTASGGGSSPIGFVGSFHPNVSGQGGYATAFENFINSATNLTPEGLPANPAPITGAAPAAAPAGPSRAAGSTRPPGSTKPATSTATTAGPDTITRLTVSPTTGVTYASCEGTYRVGQQVRVTGSGFAPSASVTVYASSNGLTNGEQQIGTVTADSTGAIDTVVAIPLGATGLDQGSSNANLLGLDAIGIGADGSSHADASAMVQLATQRSICGGATPLAGGEYHTLAVSSDGTVSAWGNNSYGQLGTGTTASSTTAVQVSGLSGASEVTAGDVSSYALTSTGSVYAWGNNSYGQLGTGSTTSSAVPVQVTGVSNVLQLAAGNDHVLALNSDGTVDAWGLNNAGQLGNTTSGYSPTPVAVPGLSHVVQVAAGGLPGWAGHSVALESDGTVWTWGYGKHGQLGLGADASTPTPTQVPGLTGIVQVAANGDNTYALKSDGTVYAWGDDGYGQIGNVNAANNQDTPLQVNITNVNSIAAGGTVGMAIKTDGTVWDWGDNNAGQLGDGAACGKTCVTPVQAIGLTGTGSIAGGYVHSLAEEISGNVYGWGNNSYGQLGDGSTIVATEPTQATGVTAEH